MRRIAAGIFTDHLADGIFDSGISSIFDNGSLQALQSRESTKDEKKGDLLYRVRKKKKKDQNVLKYSRAGRSKKYQRYDNSLFSK